MQKEKIRRKSEKSESANLGENKRKDDLNTAKHFHSKIDSYKEWIKYKEANK